MSERAAEGRVFVCMACGKRSKTRHGENYGTDTDWGWDVSCAIHAVELDERAADAMQGQWAS